MLDAVLIEEGLGAPTVGVFTPRMGIGAPLLAGELVGWIRKAGLSVEVRVPSRAGGVAVELAKAGSWVEYGQPLVHSGEGTVAGAATRAVAGEEEVPEGVTVVRADTDGTVYLRPEPSAPPFAEVGAPVSANATLGLVEVMKTFSPVRAPRAGVLVKTCVDDAASVEAGAPLFWVGPA
ncbi:MAG: hypothetical protein EP330_15395 [Deltaproteobacteria bacterium]|nr:MAG: hypothetical protein EP330_15395 [Deltaproteobacteria bacterium]